MALERFKTFPKSAAGRETALSLLGNGGWLLADRTYRAAVSLILVIWLARYLGLEEFGLYAYALAFTGLFAAIASLGIDTILVRELINRPVQGTSLVATALVLKLLGGALALLLALIAIAIFRPDSTKLLILVAIGGSTFVLQAGDTIDAWNQSQRQNGRSAKVRSSFATLGACAKALGIVLNAPVETFLTITAIEALGVSLALLYQFGIGRLRFNRGEFQMLARNLLSLSWPLIFSGIAISIYMRIDQVMIGNLLTDADVGAYGAATRLSEAWFLLPAGVTAAVSPYLLVVFNDSKERFENYLTVLVRAFLVLSILISGIVSFFSSQIVSAIFGPGFGGASSILTVHIWGGVFVSIGLASTIWMIANGHSRFLLFQTITGAVVNVALNLFLIPLWGPVGAAWATLVSYALANYAVSAFFDFSRPFFKIVNNAMLGSRLQNGRGKC